MVKIFPTNRDILICIEIRRDKISDFLFVLFYNKICKYLLSHQYLKVILSNKYRKINFYLIVVFQDIIFFLHLSVYSF